MSIIAIVVLYKPEGRKYVDNLRNLSLQVDEVCVVDNSSCSNEDDLRDVPHLIYFPQYENIGIAAAQNIGLRYAIENNFDYILFSDPDSSIPPNAVEKLMSTQKRLSDRAYDVCAVGSTAYSETTGLPYHIKDCLVGKIPEQGVTEVTYTMNSISLIKVELFKKVGLMDESLFIDGVDDEWCWRASSQLGKRFFIVDNVIIKHNLGRSKGRIGKRNISIASPKRLYYEYRNYIWLKRRKYVPKHWVKYNGLKYIVKFFYYPLFVPPRFDNLVNIIKGIKDGLLIKNNSAKY